jgi:hypothetical protein
MHDRTRTTRTTHRQQDADHRRRALRQLLLAAADAARRGRGSLLSRHDTDSDAGDATPVRSRLTTLLAATG